jgi:hypothetical protein
MVQSKRRNKHVEMLSTDALDAPTRTARGGEMSEASTATKTKKAFVVRDNDEGGTVVVFAKTSVEARRLGANELDIDFESVESCRRAPEFDAYADRGRVPNDVLLDMGWWFTCSGCERRIDSDLKGYHTYGDMERCITLKPVFVGDAVYCCPSCVSRTEKDKRIRKEMAANAIAVFQRRVLKRFPDVAFVSQQYAYATHRNGRYAVEQIIVSFSFPGMKLGPAQFRYDYHTPYTEKRIGPSAPELTCCNGDKEAFETWAKVEMK